MCHILRISTEVWNTGGELPIEKLHVGNDCEEIYCLDFFGKSRNLPVLLCAMQTEMLTYRRQSERDPWVSSRFDMQSIERHLESGAEIFAAGYSGHKLKLASCNCAGRWSVSTSIPHVRHTTDGESSNLESN